MRNLGRILAITVTGVCLAAALAFAQTKPAPTPAPEAPSAPAQSSLVVGALQIASAAALEIEGIDINVASDSVTYSYFLKNTGTAELGLAASLAMPELKISADGSETWVLASNNPENPVGLSITAAGAPVATKAEVHAYALGLDRLAEIRAEHLPLIPFGAEIDKALAQLSPEAADRLASLGIISPRDPEQPNAPRMATWSLDVVLGWRQILPAGKTTPLVVKFVPVKAQYMLGKGDEEDLDDMTDDVCLKPQVLGALRTRLKGNGVWKVTDISLSSDAPALWNDSPNPTLSVQKPQPGAIVAFCGMDDKSANQPTVLGTAPDGSEGIRIVFFEPGK